MASRRVLLPDTEIARVITLAQAHGLDIAGLDVGRDYVRLLPPVREGESVADYIGPTHRQKKAGGR
jgi:hypothetical protein